MNRVKQRQRRGRYRAGRATRVGASQRTSNTDAITAKTMAPQRSFADAAALARRRGGVS